MLCRGGTLFYVVRCASTNSSSVRSLVVLVDKLASFSSVLSFSLTFPLHAHMQTYCTVQKSAKSAPHFVVIIIISRFSKSVQVQYPSILIARKPNYTTTVRQCVV